MEHVTIAPVELRQEYCFRYRLAIVNYENEFLPLNIDPARQDSTFPVHDNKRTFHEGGARCSQKIATTAYPPLRIAVDWLEGKFLSYRALSRGGVDYCEKHQNRRHCENRYSPCHRALPVRNLVGRPPQPLPITVAPYIWYIKSRKHPSAEHQKIATIAEGIC